MKRAAFVLAITSVILSAGALTASAQITDNSFVGLLKSTSYLSYNPDTDQNDLVQPIAYQFPDQRRWGSGPFPLFVWTPGTFGSYKDGLSATFVAQMLNRGFAVASVQYANTTVLDQNCNGYTKRA